MPTPRRAARTLLHLERLEGRDLPSTAPVWAGYARDAQHTALSTVASQPLQAIHWSTPVDTHKVYSGNDLLIHYGSPMVTAANTVLVPVKTTDASGSTLFEIEAFRGSDGTLLWTQTTDYVLPASSWTPSFEPTLTPSNRLYYQGIGGQIYYSDSIDQPGATRTGSVVFYGQTAYTANPGPYNSFVKICTPLTADAAGDIYFGFQVSGTTPLFLKSGIARIDPAGNATYVYAGTAANDASILCVQMNSAPALSNDGKTLYVAVSSATTTSNTGTGYLLALDSTTLALKTRVKLLDPKSGSAATLENISTASPMVGPDGDVYFGVIENPFPSNNDRGWLLHYSGDLLTTKTPGAFGWDDTPSLVPVSMIPGYAGPSSYLLMTKYNNYDGIGTGDGQNKIAVLDPNATMTDPVTGATVMNEVRTILGPSPDPEHPGGVREWCINTAVVDPATDSVLANSEDGKLYRWCLDENVFMEQIVLTPGVGEAYTPTLIGADGTVYAVNDGTLFAVGQATHTPQSDVRISQTDTGGGSSSTNTVGKAVPGTSITYTITVTNDGPDPATGLLVSDAVPAGLTGVSWSGNGHTGSGALSDTISSLASGGSVTYTFTGTVDPSATGTLANTATVTMPPGDLTPADNTATDSDALTPKADLYITKSDGANVTTAVPGTNDTYTVTLGNNGPSTVSGATAGDVLPAGTTFVSATNGATYDAGTNTVHFTAGTLASGGMTGFQLTLAISPTLRGTLTNTASVTAPAGVTDPTGTNNSASDSDTLLPQADLSVTKSDGQANAVPGTAVSYIITVTDNGPSTLSSLSVTDTLPASLLNPVFTPGTGSYNASTGVWSGLSLASGQSITLTLSATIDPAATGTLTNSVTVAPPSGVTDPSSGNNSATDTDTLTPQADLSITKDDGQTTAAPGANTTYTIRVTNNGTSTVTGATASDVLPAGTTFVSATGGATYDAASNTVRFTAGTLAKGGSTSFQLTLAISASLTGSVSNTATVAAPSGVSDNTPANNSATDTDQLTGRISGQVYNDVLGDGVLDAGDGGRAGRTVFLDTNASGTLDSGEQSTTTDAGGNYTLAGLVAGTYHVREVVPAGWVQTTPAQDVTLVGGQAVGGVNFGTFQLVSIGGTVYLDQNDNHTQDSGEPGLANVTITLDGVAAATTNASGQFTIADVGPGTHTLAETLQSQYLLTVPASNAIGVTTQSGTNVSGQLFTNALPSTTLDDGQPGYKDSGKGWKTLQQGWNGSSRTHTAVSGSGMTAEWALPRRGGLAAGQYEIFVSYVPASDRDPAAAYSIFDSSVRVGGASVNQTQSAADGWYQGVFWKSLGKFNITRGQAKVQLAVGAGGSVDADGVQLIPAGPATAVVRGGKAAAGADLPAVAQGLAGTDIGSPITAVPAASMDAPAGSQPPRSGPAGATVTLEPRALDALFSGSVAGTTRGGKSPGFWVEGGSAGPDEPESAYFELN